MENKNFTNKQTKKAKYYKTLDIKIILWKKIKRKSKTNKTVSDQAVDCGFFQTLQLYALEFYPLPLILDSPCLAEALLLFSVSECFMNTNRFILTVVTCY